MEVALYVRVSTDKQETENQLLKLREYCARQKWTISDEYVDSISGKETSRPGFDRMFRDAHVSKFELLLFWDMSRFSRAGLSHTILKLAELDNLNIKWHSYREPYVNTDNEMVRGIVLAVLASAAKVEREKISDNTKLGLARRRAQGFLLGRRQGQKDKKKRIRRWFKKPEGGLQ